MDHQLGMQGLTHMKSIISTILLAFLLASCAAPTLSGDAIQAAIAQTQVGWTVAPPNTPYPTYTAFPSYTPQPTIAVEVTRIVEVTPTFTSTPMHTPTDTGTPTNTPNATQTAEAVLYAKLHGDKGNGFYLVNVDIAPGIWRSTGTTDDCYWAVTAANGDIIDNHFGMSGGTAYIPQSGFQVQFEDCGI
jgi:hypothetical protein